MKKSYYQAYIGTNSVRGSQGIYSIRIDADSFEAEIIAATQAYNTGGVALDRTERFLYAINEGMTFDGYADGGVSAYRIERNGDSKNYWQFLKQTSISTSSG